MRLITLSMLAILAACGTTTNTGTPRSPAALQPVAADAVPSSGVANSCGARRHGSLVGKDATVLETVLILGPIQIVRPASVTAQDFQPDRINFIIGADNRIERITCG